MKKIAGSAAMMAILLAGCGSKTDVNEKNFSEAIKQSLDKRGYMCFQRTGGENIDRLNSSRKAALESAGLAKNEGKHYALTDTAKPFVREVEIHDYSWGVDVHQGTAPALCWGKMSLDKIVKWEGPAPLKDHQVVTVKLLYKIEDLADWAKKPEIQTAFPETKELIESAGKKEFPLKLKLTNIGWEVCESQTTCQ